MTYVFLGGVSEVIGAEPLKLTRYGQRVELSEALAKDAASHGGLPVIPAAEFDKLGHTDDELKRFASAASHESAPAAFLEKKHKALAILHEIREKPQPPNVPAKLVIVEKGE